MTNQKAPLEANDLQSLEDVTVEVNDPIPKVSLYDTDMNRVKVQKGSKGKSTVIAFYPGAFTPVCTKEMCTFSSEIDKLNSLNANVIGISVDSPFSNKAFKETNKINFALLSDYRRKAVKKFGIELKDFKGMEGYTVAKRSVFIANKDGIITYRWVSEDPAVEPDYEEIKAALA